MQPFTMTRAIVESDATFLESGGTAMDSCWQYFDKKKEKKKLLEWGAAD